MSGHGGGYGHASRHNRRNRGQQFNGQLSGGNNLPTSTSSSVDFVPEQPAIANGTQHSTFRELNVPERRNRSTSSQNWRQEGDTGGARQQQKGRRGLVSVDQIVLPPSRRRRSSAATGSPVEEKGKSATEQSQQADEEDEEEVCFICTEPIKYYALGQCNHRTCHTCSLRLRALYKTTSCTFCKTDCPRVVFTSSATLPFTSLPPAATPFADTKLGLAFETRDQMEDSLSLLRFNCPVSPCDEVCMGWGDLKKHVHREHQVDMCNLCTTFKKIFAHEHSTYTPKQLQEHMSTDHARCEFCNIPFYDLEALQKHCKTQHEECFICVRQGIRHEYHLNYAKLEQHFRTAHFLCPHPDCLAEKFIVFESEIDLKAHSVEVHSAGTTQRSRRDARRVETNFTYGFGRTNIGQQAQSSSSNTGGNSSRHQQSFPTLDEQQSQRPSFASSNDDASSRVRRVPGLGPRVEDQQRAAREEEKAESPEAVVARHAALLKAVDEAVGGSMAKITSYRMSVRSYRSGELSADELADRIFNIFGLDIHKAEPIVESTAQLLDDEFKADALLEAWDDLKRQQDSFPSLTELGPALHGQPTTAHNTSARALRDPTQRAQQDPTVWARVERAARGKNNAATPANNRQQATTEKFPSLVPGLPAGHGGRPSAPAARGTPWAHHQAGGATTSSASSSARPTPLASPRISPNLRPTTLVPSSSSIPPLSMAASGGGTKKNNRQGGGMEFPSLPTSTVEAERRARLKAALSKPAGSVLVSDESDFLDPALVGGGASGPTWGPGFGAAAYGGAQAEGSAGSGNGGGNGKKKGKQKVVLMSHGLFNG